MSSLLELYKMSASSLNENQYVQDELLAAIKSAAAEMDPSQLLGGRKAFVIDVWSEMQMSSEYPYSAMKLEDFKKELLNLHRAGKIQLARADLALDPESMVASEIRDREATYHYIVVNQ